MLGVMDESIVQKRDGKYIYLMSLILIEDALVGAISTDLRIWLNRKKPFHWTKDKGSKLRSEIFSRFNIYNLQVVIGASEKEDTTGQAARERIWQNVLLPQASKVGVTQLQIEQRSNSQDSLDIVLIRNWCRDNSWRGVSHNHVGKNSELVWLADAAAGAWGDIYKSERQPHIFEIIEGLNLRHVSHIEL